MAHANSGVHSHQPSRIVQLASKIQSSSDIIDTFHKSTALQDLSFSATLTQAAYPIQSYSPEIERARRDAVAASLELSDLLEEPKLLIQNQILRCDFVFHRVIHDLDIAREVPLHGTITYTELAKQTGWPASVLNKILRLAIANWVFCEPRPGEIAHTAASRLLAEDPLMTDCTKLCFLALRAAMCLPEAMEKWPQREGPEQTGYVLAEPDNAGSFWADLAADPGKAASFARAMSAFQGDEFNLRHAVTAFDWAGLGDAKVVDAGGSTGGVAFLLAENFPQLEIVVEDRPEMLSNAKTRKDANVRFLKHDFFEEQPVKGADVYFFRWIFHDWTDKHCVRILRALIPALKAGARVLIMDMVLPQSGYCQ